VVPIGDGQEPLARCAITQAMVDGSWVVLQNGHFGADLLADALTQISSSDKVHGQFRLWITAAADDQFPVSVLQVCTVHSCTMQQASPIRERTYHMGSHTRQRCHSRFYPQPNQAGTRFSDRGGMQG